MKYENLVNGGNMIDKQHICYNGKAKDFKPLEAILLTKMFGNVYEKLEPEDFATDTVMPVLED
jgi:hypothetical protein